MKIKLFTLMVILPVLGFSQWSKTELRSQKIKKSQEKLEFSALYTLDATKLKQDLRNAPDRFSKSKGVVVSIPNTEGKIEKFEVWEFSNMSPELQEKHPDIRSYVGKGIDDPTVVLRFSLSPIGFSSMITKSGNSEFIEPYSEDRTVYAVFDSKAKNEKDNEPFECSVSENLGVKAIGNQNNTTNKKLAGFNIFRLALSCTGEYAQYHLTATGTPATATDAQKKAVVLAAMNASLARLNALFEKDLSLHFNLITNINDIIFLDNTTDPYAVGGGPSAAQAGISGIVPSSDYDLGHLIDKKAANGAAGVGVICINNQKARGWTAHNYPEGSKFDIDYVAHEMGHQLGAGHTFTSHNNQLDQRVEPASGNTIMAYTGIIGGDLDVQFNSNDYFHINSINQIKNTINTVTCGANTPFADPAPSVTLGGNYTIPKSTAFVLKGTTTDPNTGSYTYTIEQTDQAADAQIGTNSYAYPTKPTGPLFKSIMPVNKPVRYFPDFNKVLAGVLTTRWESVSDIARTLTFNMSVRNNNIIQPQLGQNTSSVTVDGASGPFKVTAPTFGQSASSGTAFNVTWDVAATNMAPVNTANVNIKLSTDGGQTFTILAANTPNDGSEQVTIPAGSSSANAYIMIEAVNNIYYAISPSFVVDYTVSGEACSVYTYNGPVVTITDGPGGSAISAPKVIVPLMVNNTGTITKIKVTPSIAHTFVGDIAVGIESPQGSSVLIWNRKCTDAAYSGLTATFSDAGAAFVCASPIQGNTQSYESLEIFKGHLAQGEWKLYASDNWPGDVGTINSWSLEVCTRETQNLGVNDVSSLGDDIKIYPNPSNGNFFIKSRNLSGEFKISLFDASGRLIISDSYKGNGDHTEEFNLNVPKGVYIINVNSPKGPYNQKLIIK